MAIIIGMYPVGKMGADLGHGGIQPLLLVKSLHS